MRPVATLLVWLALVFGLPQIVICGVMIFSSGWAIPLVLIFALLKSKCMRPMPKLASLSPIVCLM